MTGLSCPLDRDVLLEMEGRENPALLGYKENSDCARRGARASASLRPTQLHGVQLAIDISRGGRDEQSPRVDHVPFPESWM